jgi:hypothetical protein
MKICHIGILSICLILPLFIQTLLAEETEKTNIPFQITAFYDDYNFISSFSTAVERKRLIGCLGESKIPKDLKCQRLEDVLRRMKKLRQTMLVNDSEMVRWKGTTGSFFGFHFRPVLFIVGDVQLFEEKALVEVRSFELEPDWILRFIEEYDSHALDNDKMNALEERAKMADTAAPCLEIHRWNCQNGKWLKSASDSFFLDGKH